MEKSTFTRRCFFFNLRYFLVFFPVYQGKKDEMTGELILARPESDI